MGNKYERQEKVISTYTRQGHGKIDTKNAKELIKESERRNNKLRRKRSEKREEKGNR